MIRKHFPRRHLLNWVLLPLLLVGSGAFAGTPFQTSRTPTESAFLPHGASFSPAELTGVDGAQVQLDDVLDPDSDLRIVIFISPGCSPAFAEARIWERLAEGYPRTAVVVVAVAEDFALLQPYLYGQIALPLYRAPMEVAQALRVPGSPTIYVSTPENGIVFSEAGSRATERLERWMDERTNEAA